MTVADLLEILFDPNPDWNVPPTATVRVGTPDGARTWDLEGAHATIAGPNPEIVLEMDSWPI